jgi:hypothetical protein
MKLETACLIETKKQKVLQVCTQIGRKRRDRVDYEAVHGGHSLEIKIRRGTGEQLHYGAADAPYIACADAIITRTHSHC